MGDYEIDVEDVFIKLFVQSLKEDIRDWFLDLSMCSISSWQEFKVAFIEQFSKKIDVNTLINKLVHIQKDEKELVSIFNLKLAETIRDIPKNIIPNDVVCLVIFLGAFNEDMSFLWRDKDPTALHQAFVVARDIENNIKFSMMNSIMVASIDHSKIFHVDEKCGIGNENHYQDNTRFVVLVSSSLHHLIPSRFQVECKRK